MLDTMPLIGYFKGEVGYERVRDLIRKIEEGDIDGYYKCYYVDRGLLPIL